MRARRAASMNRNLAERRQALSSTLKRLLKEHDMLQAELGRRIGAPRYNVNGWVNGDTFPRNANILDKIAEVFGVPVTELVPSMPSPTSSDEPVEFNLNFSGNGQCHVTINMNLPFEVGTRIAQLLADTGTRS